MAPRKINPMLADGGPVGEFKPTERPVDERRQAIESQRAAKAAQPDLQTRLTGAVNKVQQAVNQLTQQNQVKPGRLVGVIDGVEYYDEQAYAAAYAAQQARLTSQSISAGESALAQAERDRASRAANAELKSWLNTFFDATKDADVINSLMSFVNEQIAQDIPTSAIMLNIRNQKFYQDRFAGNKALREKGLPELTPAEYLNFESGYSEALRMAGLDRLATRTNFSSLIGGEVSVPELQDRITNVYSRIVNADTALKNELQALKASANITDADLAESLLMGKEGAANLKRRIAMAEVGAEFTPRGLTSALGTSELVSLGVTREQARTGAEYTRAGMERLGTLANIYGEATTGLQAELESEAFRGLESRRRRMLTEREKATFAGSAGTGTPSLGTSAAGAI